MYFGGVNPKPVYNPQIHHRRSIRLAGYDYSAQGLYFITICCQDRLCRFGQIIDGEIILNENGEIASKCWLQIPEHFPHSELHEFIVMPNHIHGIIELAHGNQSDNRNVGVPLAGTQPRNPTNDVTNRVPARGTPTLGEIIGRYKSIVDYQCRKTYQSRSEEMNKLWQRNYYEHIIRDEQGYLSIADYITNNLARWPEDKFYIP